MAFLGFIPKEENGGSGGGGNRKLGRIVNKDNALKESILYLNCFFLYV